MIHSCKDCNCSPHVWCKPAPNNTTAWCMQYDISVRRLTGNQRQSFKFSQKQALGTEGVSKTTKNMADEASSS